MRSVTAGQGWADRRDRCDVELTVLAFRADGSSMAVAVRNMSYDGCLMEAEDGFVIGEKIRLVLPRMGEMKAQIRWSTLDGRAGARFMLEEIVAEEQHSRLGL